MTHWRNLFLSALGAACVALSAPCVATANASAGDDSETITLDEARQIAARALRAGDAELARTLAMGLIKADPKDAYAYSVLAAAHSKLDNPALARAAARLSYKNATSREQSFVYARTAGRIALQQKRFTASQMWLRKAAFYAPDGKATQQLSRDFAQVRAANPLSLRFNFSIAPSDNVNNGSDATLLIINGEPQPGGHIAPGSQALAGIVGTADVNATFRLNRTRKTQTFATARAYTRRVALSSAARAAAPKVSNSSLFSTWIAS